MFSDWHHQLSSNVNDKWNNLHFLALFFWILCKKIRVLNFNFHLYLRDQFSILLESRVLNIRKKTYIPIASEVLKWGLQVLPFIPIAGWEAPTARVNTMGMVSWAIWNARNKFYFERIQQHPKIILDVAIGFLEEYQRLCALQNRN